MPSLQLGTSRMSMTPTLRNLATPIVELFPVVTPIFPQFDGLFTGQPIVFTQFIQQPKFSEQSVKASVCVPDGGTVVLGGMKVVTETRTEFGPPVLSRIPYVNRLFKNVGYGREEQYEVVLLTPRIIITSEEGPVAPPEQLEVYPQPCGRTSAVPAPSCCREACGPEQLRVAPRPVASEEHEELGTDSVTLVPKFVQPLNWR